MQNIPSPPKFLYSFEGKRKFITHTGIPIIIYEIIGDELISVVCEKADFTHPNRYSIAQSLASISREAAEFYEGYIRWNYDNWATITSPYGDNKTAELTVTGTLAFLAYIEDVQEWKYLLLQGSPVQSGSHHTFCVCELNMDGTFVQTVEKIVLPIHTNTDGTPDGTIHLLVNPALIARYDPEVGGQLSSECIIRTNE